MQQFNPSDIKQLPVITYQDIPVCTTEMLAQCLGTESINLRQNFKRNRARFEEGKHFITLKGAELKEFKGRGAESHSPFYPSNLASTVNLWTERGVANHAKMLETDKAWAMYEALLDFYFHAKAQAAAPQPAQPQGVFQTYGHYKTERARLEAELEKLTATPVITTTEELDQLTGERIRIGKKDYLVADMVNIFDHYNIPRKVAEEITGLNNNNIRQHALIGRRRKGGAA